MSAAQFVAPVIAGAEAAGAARRGIGDVRDLRQTLFRNSVTPNPLAASHAA